VETLTRIVSDLAFRNVNVIERKTSIFPETVSKECSSWEWEVIPADSPEVPVVYKKIYEGKLKFSILPTLSVRDPVQKIIDKIIELKCGSAFIFINMYEFTDYYSYTLKVAFYKQMEAWC